MKGKTMNFNSNKVKKTISTIIVIILVLAMVAPMIINLVF
jgi:hypothetical protein